MSRQAKRHSLAQDILDTGRRLPHAGLAGVPAAAARPAVVLGDGIRRAEGACGDAAAAAGGGELRNCALEARLGLPPSTPTRF